MMTWSSQRSLVRAILATLLACFAGLGAAEGQPAETNQRRQLVFAKKEKTRVFQACDRSVRLNLNGPATVGDIEEVCDCVDSAFLAAQASIPEDDLAIFFWKRPEGEVISPGSLMFLSYSDYGPGKVKIAADVFNWEVRCCLQRLPVRGQLWGTSAKAWSDEPDPTSDYLGPVVSPTEGPAGPVDKSLGGLLFVELQHARHVVQEAYREAYYKSIHSRDETALKAARSAMELLERFAPEAKELPVLECSYRVEAKNGYNRWMSSRPYFYWFRPGWGSLGEALLKAAPTDHPIRAIGPPLDTCPLRQPGS